jgi:hypothetical protein
MKNRPTASTVADDTAPPLTGQDSKGTFKTLRLRTPVPPDVGAEKKVLPLVAKYGVEVGVVPVG